MVENLVLKIMDKAKAENDSDYIFSRAKVRQDLRVSGELNEEVDEALEDAGKFLLDLVDYPETHKIFFAERFETKSVEDYRELFKKELNRRRNS